MKNIIITLIMVFVSGFLMAQNNQSTINQLGEDQFAIVEQDGATNQVQIEQISEMFQFAWVFQTGESPGGENNVAKVKQKFSGLGNLSFLLQAGSNNQSFQKQKGNLNQFNIFGGFPSNLSGLADLPSGVVPSQDGDFHVLSQIAKGDRNRAWLYQAGRNHNASQFIKGDDNQVWTSQSGNTNSSEMIVYGNRNGSHYMVHEEGKFPHSDEEDGEEGSDHIGGNSAEGGMPDIIPPPHDEDHVFVPTVGVSIKQMGKGSNAEMYIEGDDNKATITQRGGEGGSGSDRTSEEVSGHFVNQDIFGDWNRIFADQRGRSHSINEYINGNDNLVLSMQKGNGSSSEISLNGSFNEIGVDQKGKENFSDVDVLGNSNGNFNLGDEYAVRVIQEGRGNNSDIDIVGNSNFIVVHQGGGAISTVNQAGDFNVVNVNQATIDDH